MEENKQIAVKDANIVVSGVRDITEYLRTLSQDEKFIGRPVLGINDRLLSFVYQCKKMKPEELAKCTRGSIAEAFKTSLDVGLPVNAHQLAYLTKYGNELVYHIGYRGYLYKIRQLRRGAHVEVHLLWPEDEFSYQSQSGRAEYTYKPAKPVRNDFNAISGGFVYMAWAQNGREYSCVHTMSKEEINAARQASKAKFGPWQTWPGEMMKKVVLRRACKLEFIGDPEMERIIENDNKEYEFSAHRAEPAQAVNYAEALPLEDMAETPAILDAETSAQADIIDAPADNGEAGE